MSIATETITTARMTQEQAVYLASYILSVRPDLSRAKLQGLMQRHTYGTDGHAVMGVEELSKHMLAVFFGSQAGTPK